MVAPKSFHQHYHFVKQLANELNTTLVGATLVDAFTLSKQELVLLFNKNNEPLTCKVIAKFHSGFLLFENAPYQKGSNALACFNEAKNNQVVKVEAHNYNRSFSMFFANNAQLIFKCYDALINVVEVVDEQITDVFRESIQNDWVYKADEFYITDETIINKLNTIAHQPNQFYIYKYTDTYYLSLTERTDELFQHTTLASEASNLFARYQLGVLAFKQAKISRIATIEGEIKRIKEQIKLSEQGIKKLSQESPFEEIGHIIMANLHAITPLSKQVELFNFYTNKNIVIKLKPDLSAAQNAAYYYRKAKNKSIELEQMEQKLLSMRNKLIHQTTLLEHVMLVNNAKQLKQYQVKTKQQEVFPFKRFTYKDFEIWVGKNATNNDLLTQKYSHKNDMWLHAKDVSGSHTVIKHKAGKPFTKELIMYAAQVAAYYSKHKGNALAPVTYTLKKFVRKPKGAEPGQVIIDKEEVIMVEPKLA